MLQALADFTISNSYCHLFYKTKSNKLLNKTYYRHKKGKFYINGDVYTRRDRKTGKITYSSNTIFNEIKPKTFYKHLRSI